MFIHSLNCLTVFIKVNRVFRLCQAGAGGRTLGWHSLWRAFVSYRCHFLLFQNEYELNVTQLVRGQIK